MADYTKAISMTKNSELLIELLKQRANTYKAMAEAEKDPTKKAEYKKLAQEDLDHANKLKNGE